MIRTELKLLPCANIEKYRRPQNYIVTHNPHINILVSKQEKETMYLFLFL